MYEGLIEEIKKYDVFDFISRLAGTTIESRNQNKTLFIDVLIDEITTFSREDFLTTHKMSAGRFRRLLNDVITNEQIRMTIDPNENIYKQRVIYHGNHWVFNGIDNDPAYYLQLLLDVVQQHICDYDIDFSNKVDRLARTILEISDSIEAALQEDTVINDESKNFYIPDSERIGRNAKIVTFDAEYIRKKIGYSDLFDELCLEFQHKGSSTLTKMGMYNPQELSLFCHPFIYDDSRNQIIVANSALLPSFLIFQIFILAKNYNMQARIFDDFNDIVFHDCKSSISLLVGNRSAKLTNGFSLVNSRVYKEAIFSISETKRLLLIFGCDEGENYSQETIHGFASNAFQNMVEKRYSQVLDWMNAKGINDDNIFVVVCISGIGRYMHLGIPHTKHKVHSISFSPFALWVVAMNEMGCEQFLFRYMRAKEMLRDLIPSLFSELNAVAFYRLNHNSFISTDDVKISEVSTFIEPGESIDYIQKAVDRVGFRQVPSWKPGDYVKVIRNSEDQNIFVTVDEDNPKVYIAISDTFGIWVITELCAEPVRIDIIRSAMDLITYWINECKAQLAELSLPYPNLVLLISIDSDTEDYSKYYSDDVVRIEDALNIEYDGRNCFLLHWTSELVMSFVSNNNEKEKHFIYLLLSKFANVFSQRIDLDSFEENFNNPFKRKMHAEEYGDHPSFRPTLHFHPRNVKNEDLSYLNDVVIPQYTSSRSDNKGEIGYEKRSKYMTDAVTYLYRILQNEVKKMSPIHLLEQIYYDIESNTYNLLHLTGIYKYEVSCYPNKQKKFLEQYNELNRSLVAQKFLIEYITACPPNGDHKFDTLEYEWVLSICSSIIEYAHNADLFKYDIFHTPVEILPSGRIGMNHTEFNFMNNIGSRYRDEELDFGSDYRKPAMPSVIIPGIDDRLDKAFLAEFGYTKMQLSDVVYSMCRIGMNKGRQFEVFISARDHLVKEIVEAQETGSLTEKIVEQVINDLSMRSRDDFLVPPEGYKQYEVWPWRFNRKYSFMRKPLLVRKRLLEDKEDIIWGIRSVDRMLHFVLHSIKVGTFPAQSKELKELMGYFTKERGKNFNNYVYELISGMGRYIVERNVDKINGIYIQKDKQALGDIDVLVIDQDMNVILAVEVKAFRYARTPYEMAQEHKVMFEGDKSYQKKHQRRVEWLKEHIDDVKSEYHLENADWKVRGVFIVNEPQVSKDIYKHEMVIISKSELTAEKIEHVIKSVK